MPIVNTNFYSPVFTKGLANLRLTERNLSDSVEKLSSGSRLTNSAEDPSGKILANKFQAQVSGLGIASGNAQDALSLLQVASSGIDETTSLLIRMRDLALRTMNSSTLTASDVTTLQTEFDDLRTEINRKASAVTFNSQTLFDGTFANGIAAQIGADNGAAYQITITIQSLVVSTLANATTDLAAVQLSGDGVNSAAGHAASALEALSLSIDYISNVQAALGTQEVKLNAVVSDLSSQEVNTSAALSRIQDADMASEISTFSRLQIIAQAGVAVIAQGDTVTNRIVRLLDSL